MLKHYGAIYADPPWRFRTYDNAISVGRGEAPHYLSMRVDDIAALPIGDLAADDCALFLWMSWPQLLDALRVIDAWGFEYKSCAFAWMKARIDQIEMFDDAKIDQMGMGYWTRANSEVCLLATRGNPERVDRGVRQAIIEPRREHSRKPDCVYGRIERLVGGPYLELFARTRRPGWDAWGNEVERFASWAG